MLEVYVLKYNNFNIKFRSEKMADKLELTWYGKYKQENINKKI